MTFAWLVQSGSLQKKTKACSRSFNSPFLKQKLHSSYFLASTSTSSHSEHRSTTKIEPTIEDKHNSEKKDITEEEPTSNKSQNPFKESISSKNSEISKIENSDFSKSSSSRHSTLATKLPLTDKSASTSKSSSKLENPISTSIHHQATMKDWLQPLTHSEMDYEIHQSLMKSKEEKILSEQKLIENKLIKLQKENEEKSSSDNDRQKRLNWIELEIKHLENLKSLLEKEKSMKEKIDLLTKNMPEEKIIYENIEKNIEKNVEPISDRREPMELPVNSWNSHKNMEKIIRNRSKLETPSTNDESFRNFVSERKENFIKKYEKEHGQFYDDSKNLYTKPYSDHYSEPNENKKKPPKFIYAKHTTNASTSINSSDLFLSSNSISIPINSTTSNTTGSSGNFKTGREYGTQTSDSMTKTKPIFENQINPKKTKTSMIDKSKNHKQQQVRPQPVAYLLTFDSISVGSSCKSSFNKMSSKQEQEKIQEKENKERIIEEVKIKIPKLIEEKSLEETTDSDDSSVVSQKLTLQGNLMKNRPDFLSKAEERRKCVAQLNKLR